MTSGTGPAARKDEPTGPPVGSMLGGKYRLHKVLGQGGMGRVYAAENIKTGKRVAIKWLLEESAGGEMMARFAREARSAGRVHHPNVVDVYDVLEEDGTACLVMELLRGAPLDEVIAQQGPLPISDAVGIVIEAARGVAAAHREGVIHRDLKPANLFLCSEGAARVKVVDFGISKPINEEAATPVTRTGAVVGTPHYMAPEQVRGVRELDHRVDVYALGAVLFELLTGQPPFEHDTFTGLLVRIATDPTPSPRSLRAEIPDALGEIVLHALAKAPSDRFPDVESFARALEAFGNGVRFQNEERGWVKRISGEQKPPDASTISHASTLAAPVSPVSVVRPAGSKSRARLWIALGVAAVAISGLAAWALAGPGEPAPPTTQPPDPQAAQPTDQPTEQPTARPTDQPAGDSSAQTDPQAPSTVAAEPTAEPNVAVAAPVETSSQRAPNTSAETAPEVTRWPTERQSGPRARPPRPRPGGPRAGTLSADDF